MRKLTAAAVGIVLLGVVAFAPTNASESVNGATVIKQFGCVIVPADWGGPVVLFSTETHTVVTPSGNTKLTCHFDIPAGLEPASAQVFRGFPCGTFLGLTFDSKSTAAPGGRVLLQCRING